MAESKREKIDGRSLPVSSLTSKFHHFCFVSIGQHFIPLGSREEFIVFVSGRFSHDRWLPDLAFLLTGDEGHMVLPILFALPLIGDESQKLIAIVSTGGSFVSLCFATIACW